MYNFSDFGIQYKTKILENKSEMYLLKRKGFPVHIQACIKAGSRYNNIPGLAHFLEHILVAGTKSYQSKLELAKVLEGVGGYFDATTDADFLRITISVPQGKYISLATSILNEILTAPLFSENDFKNEQKVILREQEDKYRDNYLLIMDKFMGCAYPDFELRFQNLGTSESVSKIKLDDIVNFFKNYIRAERTSFIVSGDFEFDEIENHLSSIILPKDSNDILQESLLCRNDEQKFIYESLHTKNNNVFLGFRCDTSSYQEVVALNMIQQMFIGRGGLLMQELRYKRGLVYSGSVPLWSFTGTSVFGFGTNCAEEKTVEVFDIMLNILKDIYTRGISESECDNLKIKTDSHCRFNLQSSRQWMDMRSLILRHCHYSEEEINILSLLSQTQEINFEILTEIFRKYFNQKFACGIVLGELSNDANKKLNNLLV